MQPHSDKGHYYDADLFAFRLVNDFPRRSFIIMLLLRARRIIKVGFWLGSAHKKGVRLWKALESFALNTTVDVIDVGIKNHNEIFGAQNLLVPTCLPKR